MTTTKHETTRIGAHRIKRALEALRFVRAFEQAGLDVALLKGPVLGEVAWGGVENRGFDDIDLLVRPGKLRQAGGVLEALGYRIAGGSLDYPPSAGAVRAGSVPTEISYCHEGTRSVVELHPRLVSLALEPVFDEALLWERLERVSVLGVMTPTTGPVDTLLHLAANGLKHGWAAGRYAADFARYARERAGETVIAQVLSESRSRGCRRMVLIAACLAERTGDWVLPDVCRQALDDDPRARVIAQEYAAAMTGEPEAGCTSARLVMGQRHAWDSPLLQMTWLARLLFQPNSLDYAWIKLPEGLWALSWLVRPVRLLVAWVLKPVFH